MNLRHIHRKWFDKRKLKEESCQQHFQRVTLSTITGVPLSTIMLMRDTTVRDLNHIIKQRSHELFSRQDIREKEFTFVLVLDNKVLTDPTTKLSEFSTRKATVIRIMETFMRHQQK